jgi:hypothetical protein
MTPSRWTWLAIVIAACLAVLAANFRMDPGPLRVAVALSFLLVVPGMVFVRLCGLGEGLTGVVLAVALSVTFETGAALAMVYARAWHPNLLLLALCAGSLFGALCEVAFRRPRAAAPF